MKLGIIGSVNEESFINAKRKDFDFIELCINYDYNLDYFYENIKNLKNWSEKYQINIQSIGRWKAPIQTNEGSLNHWEIDIAKKIIDICSYLSCENYICGINYAHEISYYENIVNAINYFTILVDYAKEKNVKISVYNCMNENFVNSPETWKIVLGHIPELGIKYDPSHAIYDKRNYLKETLDWGHRFNHTHIKGSLMLEDKRIDDPPAGLDQTDWKTFIALLYYHNYTKGLSIEPHSPIWQGELGERAINYTTKFIKSLLIELEELGE